MTADELRRLFPGASEDFIRKNSSPVRLLVIPEKPLPSPSPAETPPKTAKGQRGRRLPAETQKLKKSRVPLVRNGGTWSEAKYWGALRSCLRRLSQFWKPAQVALHAARVSWPGPRGRKHGYRCAGCGELFLRREVQVDHIVPCGKLTSLDDLPEFVRRLTPEDPAAFQVLCISKCHRAKTDNEIQKSP